MDLSRTIQELQAERRRVIELIRAMEEIQQCYSLPVEETLIRQRGRKSMGTVERRQVSERMRKYWAERRAAKQRPSLAAAGD